MIFLNFIYKIENKQLLSKWKQVQFDVKGTDDKKHKSSPKSLKLHEHP